MATYEPPRGRIRSSRNSTDFFLPLFLPRLPLRVFNLTGFLMLFLLLSFYIDCPFRFSIYLFNFLTLFQVFDLPFYIFYVFFFFFDIKMRCPTRPLHVKYNITASELVGILKSCPSMSVKIKAPPEKAFFTTYGPS